MKFGSVYDPYNAETLSSQVYYVFGTPSLSGDRLVLPNNLSSFSGVRMWALHDLIGTEIRVQTAIPMPAGTHSPDPANQSMFQLIYGKAIGGVFDNRVCLEWLKEGNLVYARWAANYSETSPGSITWHVLTGFPVAYTAEFTFLRFRCDVSAPQTAIFESSPDGDGWGATAGRGGSAATGKDLNAMSLRFQAQSYTTETPAAWHIEQLGLTPPGGKPVIGTHTVDTTSSTATVNANVTPHGVPTQWWVEYGETSGALDRQTFPLNVGAGTTPVSMRTLLGPEKTYDALVSRERNRLDYFVKWLGRGNPYTSVPSIAKGYIGEVGWPGDDSYVVAGDTEVDERYNDLGAYIYELYRLAGLAVTYWSAGDAWVDYPLLAFGRRSGTPTILQHGIANALLAPGRLLNNLQAFAAVKLNGVNLAGAEFAAPEPPDTITAPGYSNENSGTYGLTAEYFYPSRGTMVYIYGYGVRLIRLPVRWERLQPTPGGDLDTTELAHLDSCLANAQSTGLKVIIDCHNYAGFYIDNGSGTGIRNTIDKAGSAITTDHLVDFWQKMAARYADNPVIDGFGLMNEPIMMGGIAPGTEGAPTPEEDLRGLEWEATSKAVVDALLAGGFTKPIYVSLYQYADISGSFGGAVHSDGPWMIGPDYDNVIYEAHHYFQPASDYPATYNHEITQSVSDDAGATFTDGIAPDTTYFYRIAAANIHGTVYTEETADTLFETPPPPATDLSAAGFVYGPAPLPGEPGIDISEVEAPAAVETPHFAAPFARSNGDVGVNEQDTAEEVFACEINIARCPIGFRSERPDYGIPWPAFRNAPINTAGIDAALRRLEPRGDLTIREYDDLIEQGIVDIEIDIEVKE